ncbi:MAG: hypothetical protein A2566_03340 [Candidatus Zambryskibacteria bacterium RIFOXYD1_FULL_40_13]|nr:MAG: hypothetical protein UT25_C0002G0021 [Parcubacteria group bacterium GW2011_GWC1_39_12]KKR19481.1 MAG: hypothetical protein UT49_C0002G0327 [Parcubacteria group bacterium GW2011_GWF1_39_37]KKR35107.1 MAG: hypothetical protein UT68_C0005G0056 [Parcubacteria group bacterium GW2011_GWC2_40_10]KKR52430.1 MAG: hypothetical protein UT89_C0002G0231 [Parcubacteria group bacterium GW2011_GWE1_40_20]KKR65887.1 MAG: hypothetical protein UU06_C0009G0004 [Parcubacteria group bacterium GW2011_GWB1_40_
MAITLKLTPKQIVKQKVPTAFSHRTRNWVYILEGLEGYAEAKSLREKAQLSNIVPLGEGKTTKVAWKNAAKRLDLG